MLMKTANRLSYACASIGCASFGASDKLPIKLTGEISKDLKTIRGSNNG
jgi:hypothetical protein